MNIILLGTNGAGKTTIATKLYKAGYHVFKEAPLGNHHAVASTLCLTDNHIVFDRWNVIDRAIYENEEEYLNLILKCTDVVNKNNIIFYMSNTVSEYDARPSTERAVQRPTEDVRWELDAKYFSYVNKLSEAGVHVFFIHVNPDPNVTYNLIKSIILEQGGDIHD